MLKRRSLLKSLTQAGVALSWPRGALPQQSVVQLPIPEWKLGEQASFLPLTRLDAYADRLDKLSVKSADSCFLGFLVPVLRTTKPSSRSPLP